MKSGKRSSAPCPNRIEKTYPNVRTRSLREPVMNIRAIAFAILGVAAGAFLLVQFFGTGGSGAEDGRLLTPEDARAMISDRQDSDDFFILDVRTPPEFSSGHIEGAANTPTGEIAGWMGTLPRNATYLVYCATGVRSARVRSLMEEAGFDRVHEIRGGFTAWQAERF